MGQEFTMNLAGQVASDPTDGSWSGWPWRSHFQNDLFTICWELQAISLLLPLYCLSSFSSLSPPSSLYPYFLSVYMVFIGSSSFAPSLVFTPILLRPQS